MSSQSPQPKELPPPLALSNLVTGFWVSQAIYVAAELRLADLLRDGSRTSEELARAAGADPRSLYRLLRALASVGVFRQLGDGRFTLTPMAESMQSDVPGSMRAWCLTMGMEAGFRSWTKLLHSVKTGETAFDHLHGMGIFDYFGQHPDDGRTFDESMTSFSATEIAGVVEAYDFSGIGTLVDIAGGHGSFLATILQAYPSIKGILADQPSVIEGARQRFEAAGLGARCRVVPINFFESVPEGGDVYMMKHIIHDWDDARSVTILKNCHRAMAGKGKLLLVEMVMRPGNDPDFGKWLDVGMLVYTGGCERTEPEYRDLLASSGFRLTRIVPTSSPVSVVEAVPA